jgi:hypothetical protein
MLSHEDRWKISSVNAGYVSFSADYDGRFGFRRSLILHGMHGIFVFFLCVLCVGMAAHLHEN